MSTPSEILASLRELATIANPGLVTRDDLRYLEDQITELERALDDLETAVRQRRSQTPTGDEDAEPS